MQRKLLSEVPFLLLHAYFYIETLKLICFFFTVVLDNFYFAVLIPAYMLCETERNVKLKNLVI